MAEDSALNTIGELEQMRYKVADMFDNPPAGRGATNGRRLTIYDVFGSNPSDKEHYVFYDVEFVYNIQDPSLNNEICYWNRLPRNEEEANQLFAMANEGDAMAMLTLGQWFGMANDFKTAFAWFMKAGEEKSTPEAYVRMGECLLEGVGVDKDPSLAVRGFEVAIELAGNSTALFNLGRCYVKGVGVEKDVEKGIAFLERAARQGNSMARCQLGYLYRDGEGVEKDLEKAREWFEKSALGYNVGAYTDLITLLLDNDDGERIIYWTQRYMELGEPRAFYTLGRLYWDGIGLEQNKDKGMKLLKNAADWDDPCAAWYLSQILYETDRDASSDYLNKALSMRYPGAELDYGKMIWDEDRDKATEYILDAASQGYQEAIGFAVEHGLIPKE